MKIWSSCIEPEGGQNLLNCRMYLPVTSPFRKVSVHSRQSEQVCRMCPLWSDRFSWKAQSGSLLLISLHHTKDIPFLCVCLLRNVVASPETVAFTSPRIHRLLRNKNMLQHALSFKGWFLFTHQTYKLWSPQRSVTIWASEVGDKSIQELFTDSSALWYGLGSPAPVTYTHFPRTLTIIAFFSKLDLFIYLSQPSLK